METDQASSERLPFEDDIRHCMTAMDQHGVILYPTDTVWGLGCRAGDEDAVQKIYRIKNREARMPFILLMTDLRQLWHYVAAPPPDLDELLEAFTGPTTVIYPGGINLPDALLGEDGTVAIRLTDDPFCRALIRRMREPLVSTSANLHGEPAPSAFAEISSAVVDRVDHAVQWRRKESGNPSPSAIMRLEADGSFTKIR